MKHALQLTVLSAAIVLAGVSIADAQRPGGDRMPIDFETLDTDGDGKITQAEMEARHLARFTEADTNGDGALSEDELAAQASERAKKRASRMMDHLDANDDGRLTQDEMRPPRGGERMFKRADKDGDGSLTREEFDEARSKMRERAKGHRKSHN